ncbi:MAG: hypothetical protein FJ144_00595 [Deltaproteobacteria bacterium]|nr:hypothetical protein [Deltaproteobacteria bacterium]
MKRWLRNSLVALGVLVALAAGAWFYSTAREAVPETSTFELDLGEARRLARARADHIVFTHEHGDHIDGAARHEPPEEIASRVRFNRAQLENAPRLDEVAMPEVLRRTTPIDYDGLHALSPGVVLIAAPGHTPGNQLVFVVLEDGRELLFIGDVAWHMDALRNLHYRPRLVTDWFLGEDRAAVLAQFRTLHDLLETDPKVQVVVSHDPDQRAELLRTGALVDGFSLASP